MLIKNRIITKKNLKRHKKKTPRMCTTQLFVSPCIQEQNVLTQATVYNPDLCPTEFPNGADKTLSQTTSENQPYNVPL